MAASQHSLAASRHSQSKLVQACVLLLANAPLVCTWTWSFLLAQPQITSYDEMSLVQSINNIERWQYWSESQSPIVSERSRCVHVSVIILTWSTSDHKLRWNEPSIINHQYPTLTCWPESQILEESSINISTLLSTMFDIFHGRRTKFWALPPHPHFQSYASHSNQGL